MTVSPIISGGLSKRRVSHASSSFLFFFFFNDTATTEIYTLSLHDALPIYREGVLAVCEVAVGGPAGGTACEFEIGRAHVELQSQSNLVCRLLLGKKNQQSHIYLAALRISRDDGTMISDRPAIE